MEIGNAKPLEPKSVTTESFHISSSDKTHKLCRCGSVNCNNDTCSDPNDLRSKEEVLEYPENSQTDSEKTIVEGDREFSQIPPPKTVEPEDEQSREDESSSSSSSSESSTISNATAIEPISDDECLCSFADKKNLLLQQYIDYFNEQIQFSKHLQKLDLSRPTRDQATNLDLPNLHPGGCEQSCCGGCSARCANRDGRTCAINRNINGEIIDWLNASSLYAKPVPVVPVSNRKYIIVQCADMVADSGASLQASDYNTTESSDTPAESQTTRFPEHIVKAKQKSTSSQYESISDESISLEEGASKSVTAMNKGVQAETIANPQNTQTSRQEERVKRPLNIRICGCVPCNCKGQPSMTIKSHAPPAHTKALNNLAKQISLKMANTEADKVSQKNPHCPIKSNTWEMSDVDIEPKPCWTCDGNMPVNKPPCRAERDMVMENRFVDKPSAVDSFTQFEDTKALNNVTFYDGCPGVAAALEVSDAIPQCNPCQVSERLPEANMCMGKSKNTNNRCRGPRYCIDIQRPRHSFYPNTAIQVCSYELIPPPVTQKLSATSKPESLTKVNSLFDKMNKQATPPTPISLSTQSDNDNESLESKFIPSPTNPSPDLRAPSVNVEKEEEDDSVKRLERRPKSSMSKYSRKPSFEKSAIMKRVSVNRDEDESRDSTSQSTSKVTEEVVIVPSMDSVEERVKNLRLNLLILKEEGHGVQENRSQASLRNRDLNFNDGMENLPEEPPAGTYLPRNSHKS